MYHLTGIETHIDFGFGITGESYYAAAESLYNAKDDLKVVQQKEMPVNFLYRHSIELYLKSLIVIFHKCLKIPYDNLPYDSEKPTVYINGKWKELMNCHWVDELHNYWLTKLIKPNYDAICKLAPAGDWQENLEISNQFGLIGKYDRDSSYFRYPLTKNRMLDVEKNTMQKFEISNLIEQFSSSKPKRVLIIEDNEQIESYINQDIVLGDLTVALREVAGYFDTYHYMARCTLCNGK